MQFANSPVAPMKSHVLFSFFAEITFGSPMDHFWVPYVSQDRPSDPPSVPLGQFMPKNLISTACDWRIRKKCAALWANTAVGFI